MQGRRSKEESGKVGTVIESKIPGAMWKVAHLLSPILCPSLAPVLARAYSCRLGLPALSPEQRQMHVLGHDPNQSRRADVYLVPDTQEGGLGGETSLCSPGQVTSSLSASTSPSV